MTASTSLSMLSYLYKRQEKQVAINISESRRFMLRKLIDILEYDEYSNSQMTMIIYLKQLITGVDETVTHVMSFIEKYTIESFTRPGIVSLYVCMKDDLDEHLNLKASKHTKDLLNALDRKYFLAFA